jgi:hypothetical protein
VNKGTSLREPLVPDDDDPAIGLQDAREFAAGGVLIEPVEGLACSYEVHAGIVERGGLRRSVHACESVEGGEIFLASLSHGFVGLDAENAIAVFQKEFAQKACA